MADVSHSPQSDIAQAGLAPPSLNVQINVDSLHVNQSSLKAIVELNKANPELALELVRQSPHAMRIHERKFRLGAICALVLGLTMVVGSTVVVVTNGFWSGVGLFFCFMTVVAMFSVILNGHFPDISWLPSMLRPGRNEKEVHRTDR